MDEIVHKPVTNTASIKDCVYTWIGTITRIFVIILCAYRLLLDGLIEFLIASSLANETKNQSNARELKNTPFAGSNQSNLDEQHRNQKKSINITIHQSFHQEYHTNLKVIPPGSRNIYANELSNEEIYRKVEEQLFQQTERISKNRKLSFLNKINLTGHIKNPVECFRKIALDILSTTENDKDKSFQSCFLQREIKARPVRETELVTTQYVAIVKDLSTSVEHNVQHIERKTLFFKRNIVHKQDVNIDLTIETGATREHALLPIIRENKVPVFRTRDSEEQEEKFQNETIDDESKSDDTEQLDKYFFSLKQMDKETQVQRLLATTMISTQDTVVSLTSNETDENIIADAKVLIKQVTAVHGFQATTTVLLRDTAASVLSKETDDDEKKAEDLAQIHPRKPMYTAKELYKLAATYMRLVRVQNSAILNETDENIIADAKVLIKQVTAVHGFQATTTVLFRDTAASVLSNETDDDEKKAEDLAQIHQRKPMYTATELCKLAATYMRLVRVQNSEILDKFEKRKEKINFMMKPETKTPKKLEARNTEKLELKVLEKKVERKAIYLEKLNAKARKKEKEDHKNILLHVDEQEAVYSEKLNAKAPENENLNIIIMYEKEKVYLPQIKENGIHQSISYCVKSSNTFTESVEANSDVQDKEKSFSNKHQFKQKGNLEQLTNLGSEEVESERNTKTAEESRKASDLKEAEHLPIVLSKMNKSKVPYAPKQYGIVKDMQWRLSLMVDDLEVCSKLSDSADVLWAPTFDNIPPTTRQVAAKAGDRGTYSTRLNSFLSGENERNIIWTNEGSVWAGTLAAAGFSYDGEDGIVVCRQCGCRSNTQEWEDNDEEYAFAMHRKVGNQNCPFLRTFGHT